MSGFKDLNHHFQMVGTDAIRVFQDGYSTQIFGIPELWEEYRKTIEPNNPSRRYVIERAIETLEGKSPEDVRRLKSEPRFEWVSRWKRLPRGGAKRAIDPKKLPIRKTRRSALRRFWERLLGI